MILLRKLKQWFQTMKSNNVLSKKYPPYYNLVKPKGTKPTMVYFIVRIKTNKYVYLQDVKCTPINGRRTKLK